MAWMRSMTVPASTSLRRAISLSGSRWKPCSWSSEIASIFALIGSLKSTGSFTSVFDSVKVCACAQIQRIVRCGGGRHEAVGQLVLREFLECGARFDDCGFAFFPEEVNAPVSKDRRRGIIALNTLAPNFRAGLCFDATRNPAVVDHEQEVVGEEQRRLFWNVSLRFPEQRELA